jgi:hypothetical protein
MNKSIWKVLSLLALGVLLLSACNVVRGSRDLVTESRTVSNFSRVSLSGTGDVIITQDGTESLTIETDDNIMRHIKSEVRNGTLYLDVDDRTVVLPSRLIFTVGVEDLTVVSVSGSGHVEANDIESEQLDLIVSGSGKIQLNNLKSENLAVKISGSGYVETAGTVANQQIDISGSGKLEGKDLNSNTTTVRISGSGNANVWATDSLDIAVSGSGSVDYYDAPKLTLSSSGSGEIRSNGAK